MSYSARLNSLRANLKSFMDQGSNFSVIYHTHSPLITPGTKRLCVLDSSFNPPHWGHTSLVDRALNYQYHGKQHANDSMAVVLMFSVDNCDKKIPKPAPFEQRMVMMCMLADHLKKDFDVPVYVVLTNKAIFAEKSLQLQQWIQSTVGGIDGLKLTFLLGFDTLVRVFNAKYYKPQRTTEALKEFMDQNDLFVLTRDDDKDYSLEEQLRYVDDIRLGKNSECLPKWSEKIFVAPGDDSALKVSSSSIRRLIEAGNDSWKSETLPSIVDFIEEHKPYSS